MRPAGVMVMAAVASDGSMTPRFALHRERCQGENASLHQNFNRKKIVTENFNRKFNQDGAP